MEFCIVVEVSSDICGALGSFVLLFPAIRVTQQRKVLHEEIKNLADRADTIPDAVSSYLMNVLKTADERVSGYVPNDATLLLVGIGFLIAAFVLKIFFHVLTKF